MWMPAHDLSKANRGELFVFFHSVSHCTKQRLEESLQAGVDY